MSNNAQVQQHIPKFGDNLCCLGQIYRLTSRYCRLIANILSTDVEHSSLRIIYRMYRKLLALILRVIERMDERPLCVDYLGSDFWFPSRSVIGKVIARGREWDSVMRAVLPHVLDEPRVIVEVGSNIGASTVLISSLFPKAALLLIEPADRFRRYLIRNLKSKPGNVVKIEDRIIASESGLTLTIQTNSSTGTPSGADYGADLRSREDLMTVTLDDLVKELGLSGQIDFIKVDTDGYEYEVFGGGKAMIREDKPLIFAEFSPPSLRRVLGSEKELIDLFNEMMCEIFLVFSAKGDWRGIADSYEQIMFLKGDDYYVDLFTLPKGSRHEDAFRSIAQGAVPEQTELGGCQCPRLA